jgi:hypothetical protein
MYTWIEARIALVRIEALHRLHQGDVALRDHLADRQPIAAIAHGDARDETQVRRHELVGGLRVLMLLPALGQHELFLRLQHRELADFLEVARQAVRAGDNRGECFGSHRLSQAAFRLGLAPLLRGALLS